MTPGTHSYAIIGTGRPHGSEGATGFGMANTHLPNFLATGLVHLAAVADIVPDHSSSFLERHGVSAPEFTDYHEMLAEIKPEAVSICTWPHLHAEMAVAAAEAGARVIHCEKPIATLWADAKRMKAAADANGARLSFNHQRRHIKLFQAVRDALNSGAVGDLVMIEAQVGDLFDWGTHWLDMMFFYNHETEAEWVIGQIDSRTEQSIFGAKSENQSLCHFKWKNGVRGLLVSGYQASIGATHRVTGKLGVLEVLNERTYRVIGNGDAEWRTIEVPQGAHDEHRLTAEDVLRQLDDPTHRSILSIDNALHHTELIFGTYLSSKHRGRIDLPIPHEGNAFLDLLATREIGPNRA